MTSDEADRSTVPTLEMVASLAGVSRSTVSRVVNESPQVTPDVIAAVQAAIEKLNYVPNRAARTLASRKTHTVALVIPENTAKFFADPYFASVIQGAAMYLASTAYTLTLVIPAETEVPKTRRYLLGGNVDGALILSHHSDDRSYVELSNSLPVVFGGRPMTEGSDRTYIVDVDNVMAAATATQYLLDHGKKRIATIGGPQDMSAGIDRVAGWREALERAGQPTDLIEYADFTPPGGAEAMRRLLARDSSFDGVFIASAQMASGSLGVLREHGLAVPGDVGITTVDNDYFAINAIPPLTTIDQSSTRQGAKMAEVLVRVMEGEDVDAFTTMPTELIERESV